mgnify:CR=1 FL=1
MYLSESNFDFSGKKAILRIDADVDLVKKGKGLVVDEDYRLNCALPSLRFLQEKKVSQIILLAHLGRPGGKVVKELSLRPVADWFEKKLGGCFLVSLKNQKIEKKGKLVLLENLRFDPKERENDRGFVKKLASLGDVFVNDAFSNSHRTHASITGLPKVLPSFLGLRMEGEIKTLSWLKNSVPRPLVFVLGGSKKGKVDYIDFLSKWADYLLVGGKLPQLAKKKIKNVIWASLKENGKDLNEKSIKEFKRVIKKAKTIVWAGPMGVYEEKENRAGTQEIAKAITQSKAFKIAGGGDTHRILSGMKLWREFNFVSTGGGAMLAFLKSGGLPGVKAIV